MLPIADEEAGGPDSAVDVAAPAGRAAPAPHRPATGRVARPIRWPLRAVITVHALAVFAQAVLAGRFLSGDFGMLHAHFINAQVVGAAGLTQTLLAILYWRPGRGPAWPAFASIGLSIAEPIQIAAGIYRILGVHIPLAMAIFATTVLLTAWAWRPTFGARRPARETAP